MTEHIARNPLLDSIRMPGSTFRLPSGGLLYKPGDGTLDPMVTDGELVVNPMTTIDEIEMKTPDLLFSGKAVKQVFARCIPQILDTDKILARDVDFLIVCLRKVSYGDNMKMEWAHDCKTAKENEYTVSVDDFIKTSKRLEAAKLATDFTVKLGNNQKAIITPILFGDYIKLMQASDKEKLTPDQIASKLFDTVSKIIVSVDNITNKTQIVEWLSKLPPLLMKQINDSIDKTMEWGPVFSTKVKCKDCNQEVSVQVPLNPLAFFT